MDLRGCVLGLSVCDGGAKLPLGSTVCCSKSVERNVHLIASRARGTNNATSCPWVSVSRLSCMVSCPSYIPLRDLTCSYVRARAGGAAACTALCAAHCSLAGGQPLLPSRGTMEARHAVRRACGPMVCVCVGTICFVSGWFALAMGKSWGMKWATGGHWIIGTGWDPNGRGVSDE
jgi:hypothetical protein